MQSLKLERKSGPARIATIFLIRSWALGLSSGDRLPHAFCNSRGTLGSPPVDCHRVERIIELGAAVTAHAISTPPDGEDAAESGVMTAKQEIEQRCDLHRLHLLDGL